PAHAPRGLLPAPRRGWSVGACDGGDRKGGANRSSRVVLPRRGVPCKSDGWVRAGCRSVAPDAGVAPLRPERPREPVCSGTGGGAAGEPAWLLVARPRASAAAVAGARCCDASLSRHSPAAGPGGSGGARCLDRGNGGCGLHAAATDPDRDRSVRSGNRGRQRDGVGGGGTGANRGRGRQPPGGGGGGPSACPA